MSDQSTPGAERSERRVFAVERTDDGIVTATIDRADRANSMSPAFFDELLELVRDLETDETARVLILTGSGSVFCAGFDLDEATKLPTMGATAFLALQEQASRALGGLRTLGIPVIAAVNGAAAGGGLSLALVADIRLAAPNAKFNAAFVRIGFSAGDLGASWLLPRLVGPGYAAELAFTGRQVRAEEAERIGLVNRVSAEGELLADARALAAQIVANSPAGIRISKSALRLGQESSFAAAAEIENRGQTLLTGTTDFSEALTAFREKRDPRFTGH